MMNWENRKKSEEWARHKSEEFCKADSDLTFAEWCYQQGKADTIEEKEEKTSKLISELKEIPQKCSNEDYEEYHVLADELLLKFIGNEEVTKTFKDIPKYYA